MFTPQDYYFCNSVNLQTYYNLPNSVPLKCGLCSSDKTTHFLQVTNLHGKAVFWYFCPNCGFGGTGLEYLARLNNTSKYETLTKAVKNNTVTGVTEKIAQKYHKYSQNCDKFWERYCQCGQFDRVASSALGNIYNLDSYTQAAKFRTDSRLGFEKLFYPRLIAQNADNNPSKQRVFKGKGWNNITLIPLYDLPMRVSGFFFINGKENGHISTTLKRVGPHNGNGTYAFEPGFLAPNTIYDGKPTANNIVLSTNWLTVLTLQADYAYQTGGKNAPIIGWFPQQIYQQGVWKYQWTYLQNIPKVFWSPAEDTLTLREACITNSLFSTAYYTGKGIVRLNLPADTPVSIILKTIIKSSLIWYKALTQYLESDIANLVGNLDRLNLPQAVMEAYMSKAPEQLRKTIIAKYKTFSATSRFVNNELILSGLHGWCLTDDKTNIVKSVLTNTRCFIDQVINIAGSEPIYQGRILVGEQEIQFTEQESTFEKNPLQVVKQHCINHAAPVFPRINVSKEKYLRLIREHSECKMLHFNEGFGWSDTHNTLVLPNITLSDGVALDNQLRLTTCPLHKLRIEHTEALTTTDRDVLKAFPDETPYVLALLISLVPPLFAPAYRMVPPQTIVLGSHGLLFQQLFENMLGLPFFNLQDTIAINKYLTTHRCPCAIKQTTGGSGSKAHLNRMTWADAVGFNNQSFIFTNLANGLSRLAYGHSNMVMLPTLHFYRWTEGKLPEVFLKCIGNLLKHLSSYVLEPTVMSDNWNSDIIEHAINYVEAELRLPVNKATLFDAYYDSTPYLCDYITLLQQMELLPITRTDDYWSISVTDFSNCFRQHVGLFDFRQIKQMAQQSGLLVDHIADENVFRLDTALMEKSVRRLESVHGTLIRRM
jgi:hypothetical protein